MTDLLLCPPTSRPPAVTGVARACYECGRPVWVSLVMAPAVDDGETRPWCDPCAVRSSAELTPRQHPRQAEHGQTAAAFDQMAASILKRLRGGGGHG